MSEPGPLIEMRWDGVFADDFTLERVRQCGRHLAQSFAQHGVSCLVAYDNRFMSDLFARDLFHTLGHHGVNVHFSTISIPLPAIYHALRQNLADCAVVVSAGNKPYWYNGLVLLRPANLPITLCPETSSPMHREEFSPFPLPQERSGGAGQTTPLSTVSRSSSATGQLPVLVGSSSQTGSLPIVAGSSTQATSSALSGGGSAPTTPLGKSQKDHFDLRRSYVAVLLEQIDEECIRRSTMTIFVDSMHGTTAGYLPAIIGEQSQAMAIEINREVDPLFNKVTPLPAAANLTRLRKLVRESDSHLGLAFSADGTALGLVDKHGESVEPVEIVLLLADYLARHYRYQGIVVIPAPGMDNVGGESITLSGLEDWSQSLGLQLWFSPSASEQMADILRNNPRDLLIGGTLDGEVIVGKYNRHPDALLAGLLMIEMTARSGGNLQALLTQIRMNLTDTR